MTQRAIANGDEISPGVVERIMTAPGPATPTQTLSFRAGVETLYGEWFVPPPDAGRARGLAIVLHGYAEHCGRYREVANVLARAGWAVFSYDMRGHGQSSGKRGHVDRYAEYHDDLDAAIAKGRELALTAGLPEGPRILVAHSNGSLVALSALADPARRPDVVAAILASPFLGLKLKVSPIKKLLARASSKLAPGLTLANALHVADLTHDLEMQRARTGDALCHAVATARWFTEATGMQERVAATATSIAVPTLWLIGGDDRIADASVSEAIAHTVPRAQIHRLDQQFHEVFNEVQRPRTFELVTDFLRAL